MINLNGGNVDTLTKGNNRVENNLITRYGTKHKGSNAVVIYGCGNTVANNNISSGAFHAITYYGNDHEILYNEIYNVNKCTDDVGAIYTGRNYIARGTEIAYNYLHDLNPIVQQSRGFNLAIYWDDSACGQNAHHNIIVNSNVPIYACGQMNFYKNNTMINSREGMSFNNNYANDPARIERWQESVANILNPELYNQHYENFAKGATDLWATRNAFNQVIGNLNVNGGIVTLSSHTVDYGTVESNVELDTCDDFVDPENQDYRLKSGSTRDLVLPGLLDESFDIEQIGTQQDIVLNSETASFRQFYPKNGALGEKSTELTLWWENAMGANRYRVVIAKDPELQNVVYDEIVDYNSCTVPYLDSGVTYYWKVYARNISREFGAEWESSSAPYMFTTALYSQNDVSKLNEEIEKAEAQISKIQETGENGDYPVGTKAELEELLAEGRKLAGAKIGKTTQQQVDNKAQQIAAFLDSKRINIPGYMNLGKYIFNPDVWPSTGITVSDDAVVFSGSEQYLGTAAVEDVSDKDIFCFKAKINTDNWVGLGIATSDENPLYGAGNAGYFLAIKADTIELQKNLGGRSEILET